MKMEEQERPIVYLKPGELFVSRESAIVSTVLGSCVSVTMFSPELRMGAICHALLPVENSSGESFRYVDTSILSMLEEFGRHGISRTRLEVKLFGGSSMLSDNAEGTGELRWEGRTSRRPCKSLKRNACRLSHPTLEAQMEERFISLPIPAPYF